MADILVAPDFVTDRNITHVVEQKDLMVFALELQEEVSLCHMIVRKTDQPSIVVLGRPDFYFQKTELLPQNKGLEAYLNTKLTLNRKFT